MEGFGAYRGLRFRREPETNREMKGLRIAPDKASRSAGRAILRYSVASFRFRIQNIGPSLGPRASHMGVPLSGDRRAIPLEAEQT